MITMPRVLYRELKGYRKKDEPDGNFHQDVDIARNFHTGFHELCEGCQHIVVSKGVKGRHCVYILQPKIRKFPCYFRDNVEAGGFDGQYGATVNNFIQTKIEHPFTIRSKKLEAQRAKYSPRIPVEGSSTIKVEEEIVDDNSNVFLGE